MKLVIWKNRFKNYRRYLDMIELLKDLWAYMKVRKKYWLLPLILILILLGVLIVFSSGTAVAPFIYTLF